jgi:hypothetical protein
MNLEKLGQWMGIFANLGVFAGFLLVAYQLHQTTVGLQSSSVSTSNQIFADSDMAMMGDSTFEAFAHSLTDPASLTPAELTQLWGYSSVTMFSANVAFDDYRQGIISEDRWEAVRDTYISYINHPVGRIIWAEQSKAFVNSNNHAFFDSVQERLDAVRPNETLMVFRAMRKAIRALPSEDGSVAGSAPSAAGRSVSP